jgi:thymidylate synthase (FAD)
MIIIGKETTKFPLQKIGETAGVCYNSDISNIEKNINRAKDCINSGHGRVLEWVDVELIIDGYSAKVIREFERHHIGASFLQSSTRYINYDNFKYVTPYEIKKNELLDFKYQRAMQQIKDTYKELLDNGISKEDASMLLPLGMTTKIVDKRNLRNLVEMSHLRLCSRAFWEYRQFFEDICIELSKVSDEWKYIVDSYFKPKCEVFGYCTEKNSCGRKPTIKRVNYTCLV